MSTEPGNKEPIRVAHVIGRLTAAGVEAVINNYYRHIDHDKYQFDYIVDDDSPCQPPQELIDMGARYYHVPPYHKLPQYMETLIKLFRKNRYSIVHSSLNTLSVFPLCAAQIAGVPIRINHNHSTSTPGDLKRNLMKNVLRPFARTFATHLCACSRYSGEWLYGKKAMEQGKVTVFNNSIDTEKFAFDPAVRAEVRKKLGLTDEFVIGHVGRFCYQKNQEFLIDIFSALREQDANAVLLLIGIGEDEEKIRNKVKELGLRDAVRFLGVRNDVARLYQAMDVFVLPSRYEGLPVVGVEAQAAGLPVFASDQMTAETAVSPNIRFLSLSDPAEWAAAIRNASISDRCVRIDPKFDITSEAQKLQSFYDLSLQEKCSIELSDGSLYNYRQEI